LPAGSVPSGRSLPSSPDNHLHGEPEAARPPSASRRVRARLARRMTLQRSSFNPVLEPLVATHRSIYPKADLSMLQRAYEVADAKHASQLRRSGDPYITHPLAVAGILRLYLRKRVKDNYIREVAQA